MMGSKNYIINDLEQENKYLKERCKRFGNVMLKYGISTDLSFTDGDIEYLDNLSGVEYAASKKVVEGSCVQSHDEWIWERIDILRNAISDADNYTEELRYEFANELEGLLEEQLDIIKEKATNLYNQKEGNY